MSTTLLHPVKNFKCKPYPQGDVTQFFGENVPLYASVCALPGVCLTKGHNGLDIVRPWGEPIMPVQAGKVVEVNDSPKGYGKHIKILTEDSEWVYGHLSQIEVKLGDHVVPGQIIGRMGNTGFVVSGATPYWKYNPYAGTHLHLGRRMVKHAKGTEPSNLQYSTGDRVMILNYDNGSLGAVPITEADFEPVSPDLPPASPTLQMTLDSLENHAVASEKAGNHAQAAIYRAVKGLVKAFWA